MKLTLTVGEPAEIISLDSPSHPITNPRDAYVYFHRDRHGNVFYIGKGRGRRAWAYGRGPLWIKYVEERSGGIWTAEVFRDGLTDDESEELESELISQHGERLVNWVNYGRPVDLDALRRFHQLRDANRELYWPGKSDTRHLEKSNPDEAIRRYRIAIQKMPEYARIQSDTGGLVAELQGPQCWDDPFVIDRLTLLLVRLGRTEEAMRATESYFELFPESRDSPTGQRVQKRVSRR